jgi:hypothetical protein
VDMSQTKSSHPHPTSLYSPGSFSLFSVWVACDQLNGVFLGDLFKFLTKQRDHFMHPSRTFSSMNFWKIHFNRF